MYVYQADTWCDGCAEEIKDAIIKEARQAVGLVTPVTYACGDDDFDLGFDPDDEYTYDSDEFPKGPYDSDESDCPNHCADCGIFLENSLTTDGADYVREAVREDLAAGVFDSVAVTEWMPYYDYIDYGPEDICTACGDWSELDENGECDSCADRRDDPDDLYGLEFYHPCA